MRDILAMILAGGRVDELGVLTVNRPKAAVPFGGLYRVIDFPLSNLMHSGIERVGILSQYRPFSLMNHIGNGYAWDMIGRNRSIHILPPFQGYQPSDWYRGNADAIYQNLDYIKSHDPSLVLILSGDHIYKMDYRKLVDFHEDNNADLTVAFKEVPMSEASRFGQGEMAEETPLGGRLLRYAEKAADPISPWASLTIYLFRPAVLYEVAEEIIGRQKKTEFGRDVIPAMLDAYDVFGYKFDGYWGYTRTIQEYYRTNMCLLGDKPEVDPDEWKIRTNLAHGRLQDRAPALVGPRAAVRNSMFYNGCRIDGEVYNSILFPGVRVAAGAKVSDSIIMFDTQIGEAAVVESAIIDTEVAVGAGVHIGTFHQNGKDIPENISEEELVVIGQNVALPNNLVIPKGCRIMPGLRSDFFAKRKFLQGETIG